MTILEITIILVVIFGVLYYIRRGQKHTRHKWQYMFSAGESNMYNWYYCTECMIQCVAKITDEGMIELQNYEVKKPWRPKK